MSAIAGIFCASGKPVEPGHLRRLLEAMKTLGQDRQDIWRRGSIGLIHSIMRISPEDYLDRLASESDHFAITADVRLDNRDELSGQLGIDLAVSRAMSDSAFVLAAYRKWGEACPSHLLGDFAFGIWDPEQQRLFCARDHLGTCPLYHHQSHTLFAFASVATHLLSLPGVTTQLDEVRIAEHLVLLPGSPQSTYYKQIQCLPPGHSLTVSSQAINIRQYWSLKHIPEVSFKCDEDYVENFGELLETAVACRLRTTHQVGSFLSGGLDSSSIAVTAARHLRLQNRRLLTYTSVPRRGYSGTDRLGKFADERPFVKAIADLTPNLDPHYVTMEARSLLDNYEPVFSIAGPPLNVFNYMWQQSIGSLARQQGVKLMLGGDAGNFAMSRPGVISLAQLALEGQWSTLLDHLRSLTKLVGRSVMWHFQVGVLKPLFSFGGSSWPRRANVLQSGEHWTKLSAINPEFARSHDLTNRLQEFETQVGAFNSTQLRDRTRMNVALVLGNSNRDLGSTWKSFHQIAIRDPSRDRRLVAFCLGVPENQYCRNGQDRLLIRRTMSDRLPASVVWNRKIGHQGGDWMETFDSVATELAGELERLRFIDLAARILDLNRMKRLLERWPAIDHYGSRAERLYRHLFSRGFIMGKFLAWHTGLNSSKADQR